MNNTFKTFFSSVLVLAAGTMLFACAVTHSTAKKHPVGVPTMPVCSDCHKDWKTALDHRTDYITKHKFYALQQKGTCDICHVESFCADCHANKEEIKPSDKYKDQPARSMPHKGDYLNQHKIDGKINPASCFPCHGRQNNEQCRVCHLNQ
jgi:hypothetical protein